MIYATKEDLAVWLGYLDVNGDPDTTNLPGDVETMLRNASRVIDHATMKQFNINDDKHLEVLKNATTSQCEYWIDGVDESVDIQPNLDGYSAGKTKFDYRNGIPKLSPRARRELWLGGLYNRRVIST